MLVQRGGKFLSLCRFPFAKIQLSSGSFNGIASTGGIHCSNEYYFTMENTVPCLAKKDEFFAGYFEMFFHLISQQQNEGERRKNRERQEDEEEEEKE